MNTPPNSPSLPGRRPALGRGLSALIPPKPVGTPGTAMGSGILAGPGLMMLGIETISPSESQPRKNFDDQTLQELADSISTHGVLQPIVVRRTGPSNFELVAGERRWRAAQKAGLKEIPAVLKDVAPQEVLTLALVENLQREDLNPMEEAEAYRHLMDTLDLTQEQVAQRVGKDRTTVTNAIRLLKLPPAAREAVTNGQLSMGHARALLSLLDAELEQPDEALLRAAREVMAKNLSVRATEALVKARKAKPAPSEEPSAPTDDGANRRDLEDRLRQKFGVKTMVHNKNGKGTIEFYFSSLDELDGLLSRLGVN